MRLVNSFFCHALRLTSLGLTAALDNFVYKQSKITFRVSAVEHMYRKWMHLCSLTALSAIINDLNEVQPKWNNYNIDGIQLDLCSRKTKFHAFENPSQAKAFNNHRKDTKHQIKQIRFVVKCNWNAYDATKCRWRQRQWQCVVLCFFAISRGPNQTNSYGRTANGVVSFTQQS